MTTVVEKVILLSAVDVFTEVPSESLAFVAAIAEELDLPAGHRIYGETDASDAMYVVLDGRVRLERDGREVTTAATNEAFGTWALFDDEPRLVAAVTMEPTRVLRVGRDAFYDVLADNVEVTRGVLKALARRLRGVLSRVGPPGGAGGGA
ncbi:MAG: Crp/Fnr family transcriptional regulator [Deltaproteobacteria bacterium]|nr:Crp/Fnr family transcriptional regulator [Deltaproteobacteria bacterium]